MIWTSTTSNCSSLPSFSHHHLSIDRYCYTVNMADQTRYEVLHDADQGNGDSEADVSEHAPLATTPRSSEDSEIPEVDDYLDDVNNFMASSDRVTVTSGSQRGSVARFTTSLSKSAVAGIAKGFSKVTDRSNWQRCADSSSDKAHSTWVTLRVLPSADVRAAMVDHWLPTDPEPYDLKDRPYLSACLNGSRRVGLTLLRPLGYIFCLVCLDCSNCSCCYDCCKNTKDEGLARFLPTRYDRSGRFDQSQWYEPAGLRRMLGMPLSAGTAEAHGYSEVSQPREMMVYAAPSETESEPAGPTSPGST